MRHLYSSVVALILLFSPLPLAAQREIAPSPSSSGRVTVLGRLRDAETNQGMENVLVQVRHFNGSTAATVFTGTNGAFHFSSLPAGTYNLVVEADGYERISQDMYLAAAVSLQLELRRQGRRGAVPSGETVSVRELLIPRKAHDAMEKGLNLLYQESDYESSLAQFQRAIKEYPDYYEAYAEMGAAYMKLGDAANSEEMLRKSIALIELSDERYVEPYVILASLFTTEERFAEAAPLARKAVELDSGTWQGYHELARALYGLDDFTGAQEHATTAAELNPDNAQTFLLLANIHGRLRDYPKLLNDLNTYLDLAPNGPQADQVRATREQVRQALDNAPTEAPPTAPDPQR